VAARRRILGGAGSVVGDLDVELLVAVADGHARMRRAGVLERVRQRLLDDAVRRQVDPRRDRARLALDPQFHGHAGLANLVDEVPEVAQAGLRRERELVVGAAQHAEQAAHLRHRGAAGRLDRRQDVGRPGPLVAERAALGARLHDHDREVVGDDVVELARDPRSLLGDRQPGLVLALLLKLDRAGCERGGELLPAAHHRRRAPHGEQDPADEDGVADDVLADRERHQHDHRADDRGGDPPVAAARVGAARVGGDEQPGERRARAVPDLVRRVGNRETGERGDEHDQRDAPTPDQRQRRPKREHRRDRPRRVEVAAGRDLDQRHRRQDERKADIDDRAPRHEATVHRRAQDFLTTSDEARIACSADDRIPVQA
jgi:hypothetical protein